MTLVIIFGPPAVGKMTVGLELARLTGFRLFHNHMTVDHLVRLFPFGSPPYTRLVAEFRQRIFEEFVATDSKGLIFSFVWPLDNPEDRAFVDGTVKTFTDSGGNVYFVELEATQDERLRRLDTPLRLAEKPLLHDIEASRELLLSTDRAYQLNSKETFFYPDRHLKIDNTTLEPEIVAQQVAEHFSLKPDPAV